MHTYDRFNNPANINATEMQLPVINVMKQIAKHHLLNEHKDVIIGDSIHIPYATWKKLTNNKKMDIAEELGKLGFALHGSVEHFITFTRRSNQ